jgi:hypothetical protein
METVSEVIPYSAWEQAVFVALFIIFVVGLLTWFTKQSDKWQNFMLTIDEKWRAFNKEQRIDNNATTSCLENSLKDLTSVTQGLVTEIKEMRIDSMRFYENFHYHDEQAKHILSEVQKIPPNNNKSKTKPPANLT